LAKLETLINTRPWVGFPFSHSAVLWDKLVEAKENIDKMASAFSVQFLGTA
jgi:hypothetical protein